MRLVVAGSPAAAVPTLRRLAASDHEIAAVLTRPPTPQGRKRVLTPTPVAQVAAELGLPVIEASRVDDAVTARLAGSTSTWASSSRTAHCCAAPRSTSRSTAG